MTSESDPKQEDVIAKVLGDSPRTKENLISLARCAETSERYADMCLFMKAAVEISKDEDEILDDTERNLLSVAYKNEVGAMRTSIRIFKQSQPDDEEIMAMYVNTVQELLTKKIDEVLELLKLLSANSKGKGNETEVFYLKMTGDYHRYRAEFTTGGDDKDNKDNEDVKKTEEFYEKAMEVAKKNLPETHPTRLGLALNYSVCHYEILKQSAKACELAKEAFDAAIEKLDTLNDASYKDSTLIMQLLRDNLTLWTSDAAPVKESDGANP